MQMKRIMFVSLGKPMRLAAASLIWIPLTIGVSAHAFAQQGAQETETLAVASAPVVPQQVRYAGKLASRVGETVEANFRIYAAAEGGEPLWTETQRIAVGEDGSYTVLLGGAESKGLPQSVFAGGVARWLGVSVENAPESERVLLASVPYAMKSADAEALAGHAASDFVTQEQLAALTAASPAQGEQPIASTAPVTSHVSGPITGTGTAGNIAQFTGANTIGNSEITQVGSDIGINVASPTATLEVGGTTTLDGTVTLSATGTATTATGTKSRALQMIGSTWSSTTSAPVAQTYTLSVTPANNNTATPGSDLVLQYQAGTSPGTNLFYVNSNGQITFSPSQTFPGTLSSVSATNPLFASTSPSGAVSLTLNTGDLIVNTLDTYFPRLTLPNTFTNSETFTSAVTINGPITATSNLSVAGTLSSAHGFQSTGSFVVLPASAATSSGGINSQLFELGGSSYSSTSASAVAQNFAWQNLVTGNNTATPSSKLALLYGSGTTAPSFTGLSIAPNGNITFSPSQTFPGGPGSGTISGITTTSPLTGSGTTGSVALGLNQSALVTDITPSLETTFDGVYAQLGTADVFSSFIEAYQTAGPGDAAILGWGSNGSVGTFGSSDSGFGVQGISLTGNGVDGISRTPALGAAAVFGVTGTSYSNTYVADATGLIASVWGDTSGVDSGTGQYAAVIGTADSGSAAFFNNNSHSIAAVDVVNADGTGILAFDDVPAIQEGGVVGTAGGTNSGEFGKYFLSAGVWGDTNGTPSSAYWVGGILGTADNAFAGLFYNDSNSWPTVYAQNDGTDGVGLFSTVMAKSKSGTCGIGGNGDLSCTGQVKSLVSAGGGSRMVETYAMQSPENWMEDFGAGVLQQGVAIVNIDPTFAETVSETADYHVFLTPKGDSKGLYVINETPTSFEVRESGGGTSSLSFDYRIVAKRRGYEALRHVDVTEHYNAELKATSIPRGTGVAGKPARPLNAALGSHPRPLALQQTPVPHRPMSRPVNATSQR